MPINFDKILGVHEQALQLRTQRASVIANNLANADTPNFKARDIDFKSVLNQQSAGNMALSTKHQRHISGFENPMFENTLYRIPNQPSIDGNTVEEQVEHAEYMKNALAFQASFEFLNSKFKGISKAFKGE